SGTRPFLRSGPAKDSDSDSDSGSGSGSDSISLLLQRRAELLQRLAALGRDVLEVELAVGDLEERAIGGEELVLGALELVRIDVAQVLADGLGLDVELVADEEAAEDELGLDRHRVDVLAGAMRQRQHFLEQIGRGR